MHAFTIIIIILVFFSTATLLFSNFRTHHQEVQAIIVRIYLMHVASCIFDVSPDPSRHDNKKQLL